MLTCLMRISDWQDNLIQKQCKTKRRKYPLCTLPFLQEKRETMELSTSVCPFFCLPDQICRPRTSATTGLIHSKLCSMEPSWPVNVQHHSHLPIGPIWHVHGRNKGVPESGRGWNSATIGWIHSKSSWLEPFWSIGVQHHDYFPIRPTWMYP